MAELGLPLSRQFDLGLDRTRIKDRRDAERQQLTAATILSRFFHHDAARSVPLQLVADEVGMGKTFVALAVAYSVLEALGEGRAPEDLAGCYQKIVVVTPNNSALFSKWKREVDEFVTRCVPAEHAAQAKVRFRAQAIERPDELVAALQKRNASHTVLVVHTGSFGARLRRSELKRRFILAVLFNQWANAFRLDARERLLKGAPDD